MCLWRMVCLCLCVFVLRVCVCGCLSRAGKVLKVRDARFSARSAVLSRPPLPFSSLSSPPFLFLPVLCSQIYLEREKEGMRYFELLGACCDNESQRYQRRYSLLFMFRNLNSRSAGHQKTPGAERDAKVSQHDFRVEQMASIRVHGRRQQPPCHSRYYLGWRWNCLS